MVDQALIKYVQSRSPEAFKVLVDRYSHAVYAQCVRQLRDPHLAEDTTQAVFMVLARKARSLPADLVLPAWLFKVTHYACSNVRRNETRRKRHEQGAAMIRETQHHEPGAAPVNDMEPILDDALTRLGRADREAIILRFYSGMNSVEVGERLGISSEAAKRRVSRAVQKLRDMLARRGVSMTSVVLLTRLDNLTLPAAPLNLIPNILAHSLNPANAGPWCDAVVKGVLHAMRWTQIKLGMAAAMAILMVGAGGSALTGVLAQGTPASPPATAPVQPDLAQRAIDQLFIRSTLERLAQAIRSNDLPAMQQHMTISDDENGSLVRAMLLENLAYRHLQTACAARENQSPTIRGFGFVWFPQLDGGLEVVLEKVTETLRDSDIQITGNTARVSLQTGVFAPGQPLDGWHGWWLSLVNDGVAWKVDMSKTLRVTVSMAFAPGKLPSTSDQEMKIAIEHKLNVVKILDGAAQALESGKLKDAAAASAQIESELKAMQAKLGLAGISYGLSSAGPRSMEP